MTALPENPSARARPMPSANPAVGRLGDWAIIKRLIRNYLGHR
jgi:hypothetical protein